MPDRRDIFHCASDWQPVFRELGIDAEGIFTHPQIKCWRRLSDRENCTLDAQLIGGREILLHIKRYAAARSRTTPSAAEAAGFRLFEQHQIPTASLVAWGVLNDRRSFVITEDLAGFEAADKVIERGSDFDRLLEPIAHLAAKVHRSGLHHRDLYLCHFFVRADSDPAEVRLIDVARVRRLPRLFARRWIVKDLAQLWYSTLALPIEEAQRIRLMEHYTLARGISFDSSLRRAIVRKVKWIARHDLRLRRAQPNRNISIPSSRVM